MKRLLFFALLILGFNSFAQKKLMATSFLSFEPNGNAQFMDSTSYIYTTWHGSILQNKMHYMFSNDLFLYDLPETMILSDQTKIYSGTAGAPSLVVDYTNTLVNGKLTKAEDNAAGNRFLYTYDAFGNMISAAQQYLSSGTWLTSDSTSHTYDSNGKLLTNATYYNASGTLYLNNTDTNTYDSSTGLLVQNAKYDLDFTSGNVLINAKSIINYIGNKVNTIDVYSANNPGVLEFDLKYKYNYFGSNLALIQVFDIIGSVPSATPFADLSYTYNAQNNPITATTKFFGDTLDHVIIQYLDNNFLSKTIGYAPDTSSNLYLSYMTTYFYENTLGVESLEQSVQVGVFPNPTKEYVWIKSESPILQIALYDINGRLLLEQNTNQIDLRDLPIGSYFLKGQTTQGVFNEKIVKL